MENDYTLSANSEFDVTLVTYFEYSRSSSFTTSVKDAAFLKPYFSRWDGFDHEVDLMLRAFSIVVYYHEDEKDKMDSFVNTCKMNKRTQCHSFLLQSSTIPINKLKNIGILHVRTTHFIFAERNLSPTSPIPSSRSRVANLYSELLRTPGYLWRDPYFVGVVPVFEWAHDAYPEAVRNYQHCYSCAVRRRNYHAYPQTLPALKECLDQYRCRPLQTATIPMVPTRRRREA
mgnify:CR=1 FL=1